MKRSIDLINPAWIDVVLNRRLVLVGLLLVT